jgi:hypothetical protein
VEFPRYVFLSPGKEQCEGGTYSGEIVSDQAEYDSALSAGFTATLPEALEKAKEIRAAAFIEVAEAPKAPEVPETPKAQEALEPMKEGPSQEEPKAEIEEPAKRRRGRPSQGG